MTRPLSFRSVFETRTDAPCVPVGYRMQSLCRRLQKVSVPFLTGNFTPGTTLHPSSCSQERCSASRMGLRSDRPMELQSGASVRDTNTCMSHPRCRPCSVEVRRLVLVTPAPCRAYPPVGVSPVAACRTDSKRGTTRGREGLRRGLVRSKRKRRRAVVGGRSSIEGRGWIGRLSKLRRECCILIGCLAERRHSSTKS